jgi:hypothetical protein
MSWRVTVMDGYVFVSVFDPLSEDDWDALYAEIVDRGKAQGAVGVVLPTSIPSTLGMAAEVHRSLADGLRKRGFTVMLDDLGRT